jgi:hypothetical protein
MKPGMKMLLISGRDNERDSQKNDRGMRNEYDMDSRYRDRRGREHYEPGRYAPRNEYMEDNYPVRKDYNMRMGDEMESRRRRDSRGRYMRSEWDGMEDNYGNEARMGGYPGRPFPVYEDGRSNMNQIGFNASEDIRTNYGMTINSHDGDEMEHRTSPKMGGGYSSNMAMPMTKEMADEWTHGMKNEDGTKGPHWTMEQIKQAMAQKGIDCNPLEMYPVMNSLYSDYCSVLKKWNMNKVDIYLDLACAWLNDSDAVPYKASAYFEHIVKK